MEYYSALKIIELSSYKTSSKLKWILISEDTVLERLHVVLFQPYEILIKGKPIETVKWLVVAKRLGKSHQGGAW